MILKVHNLRHQYGDNKVLCDVHFEVAQGQFVAFVGPSGCGKTTIFNSVLGTLIPASGKVLVDDKRVIGPCRDVGIVYQQYSLYDFLTVEENVAFGLKLDKSNMINRTFRPFWWRNLRREHLETAREWLQDFRLGHVLGCYPNQLSGGMRQRVAIAQAIVMRPKVLLLDEPFGALDEAMREELQVMLLELYAENQQAKKEGRPPPFTVVMVTHELDEAFYIADRVIGLSRYWEVADRKGDDYGATIVFDKMAPIYGPHDPRDFTRFAAEKALLRKVAFDKDTRMSPRTHCTFWEDSKNSGRIHDSGEPNHAVGSPSGNVLVEE
jgi:NitT/TauT family transport system ATP-binding protein